MAQRGGARGAQCSCDGLGCHEPGAEERNRPSLIRRPVIAAELLQDGAGVERLEWAIVGVAHRLGEGFDLCMRGDDRLLED